jgi:two-component system, NtrC family, nitrogen regulation sensor histidine kinase NtrY
MQFRITKSLLPDTSETSFRKLLQLIAAVVLISVLFSIFSFLALSTVETLPQQSELLLSIFAIASLCLVGLLFLIVRQIIRLFIEKKRKQAGSQLQLRLAVLFGVITVFPSIIVATFAVSVVDYSLRGWFSERISTAVNDSVTIADAYLEEHTRSVRGQVLAMANDVNRDGLKLAQNKQIFNRFITDQVGIRNLSEAVILDGTGQIIAKSRFAFSIIFSDLNREWLERARNDEVVISRTEDNTKIQALVKLNNFVDAYLLVGRFIDSDVLEAVDKTRLAVSDYQSLSIRQFDLQISMAAIFAVISLFLLLSALWIGLSLSGAITNPLRGIISVADAVRAGNLNSRVDIKTDLDEISLLGSSFNRMMDDLSSSQRQLVHANKQLDQRREFTEAVLSGVSSGVIGLTREGIVTLPNTAACTLLDYSKEQMIGSQLTDALPEFAELLSAIKQGKKRQYNTEVMIVRNDQQLFLQAGITSEKIEGRIVGYIVTFDDVTDLLSAQRKAAWSDIARRIAHEIKNPLTPIELAADRLKKKYRPDDPEKAEQFDQFLTIISRQVGDIGRLVDEFSSFARMPAAILIKQEISALIEEQIKLYQNEDEVIRISFSKPPHPIYIDADSGLIRQVVANLLQNAIDSLTENKVVNSLIMVDLRCDSALAFVEIKDNGPGFQTKNLAKLFEPYVTGRDAGTGLGLAIAQKIIQDHAGQIKLQNHHEGGAHITISIPLSGEKISKDDA